MGDVLPRETENTVYRYLIAISKLRLGILTEQGEGSYELVVLDLASILPAASSRRGATVFGAFSNPVRPHTTL